MRVQSLAGRCRVALGVLRGATDRAVVEDRRGTADRLREVQRDVRAILADVEELDRIRESAGRRADA
jgi:hypothetical protein